MNRLLVVLYKKNLCQVRTELAPPPLSTGANPTTTSNALPLVYKYYKDDKPLFIVQPIEGEEASPFLYSLHISKILS